MNRKRIALALVVIMLLCIGCGKKKDDVAESLPMPEVLETQPQSESLPGTAVNEFSPDGFEEMEETNPTVAPEDRYDEEPETTEPKATEPKPTEPKPTEPKPTEPKATEPKPTEPKPTEPKPTEPKPTEPKPTEPKPTEPNPTEPKPTEPKPTEPEPTEPEVTEPVEEVHQVTYEEYNNMSPEEQVAFIKKFDSMQDFLAWYKQAKAEYEKDNGSIDIEDGNIDLGGIA